MSSIYHPRAKFWAEFAAARMTRPGTSPETAARDADSLLEEFDKRWEWYEGGYGSYWCERTRTKKEKS
jgi:hypothetical protein